MKKGFGANSGIAVAVVLDAAMAHNCGFESIEYPSNPAAALALP